RGFRHLGGSSGHVRRRTRRVVHHRRRRRPALRDQPVRDLPHRRWRVGRPPRPRPHALRHPDDPGRWHARQRPREPRSVAPRSPGRQARRRDAPPGPARGTGGRARGLPREPEVNAMAVPARLLDRPPEASYLDAGGLWSWLTTVDHKRIAVLYGVTALAF